MEVISIEGEFNGSKSAFESASYIFKLLGDS
jgi:hypothetical protein